MTYCRGMSNLPVYGALTSMLLSIAGCGSAWTLTDMEGSTALRALHSGPRPAVVCTSRGPRADILCAAGIRRRSLPKRSVDTAPMTRQGHILALHPFTCSRDGRRGICWRSRPASRPMRVSLERGTDGVRWSALGTDPATRHRVYVLEPSEGTERFGDAWLLVARSDAGYVLGLFFKEVESPTVTR